MKAHRRAALTLALLLAACGERSAPQVERLVIVSVGEPMAILPPLAVQSVERDIGDLVFERLAMLEPGAASIDEGAYRPALAARWERLDSLTWRFHLRSGARWHDGRPVTAADVAYSFGVFADSAIDALARPHLAGRVLVELEDASTLRLRFSESYPEQLYDATAHVRVLPRHVWASVASTEWRSDTALARLVGSGPYRIHAWRRGEYLELEADTSGARVPAIGRVAWRFVADPDAALNLLLAHDADAIETVGAPDRAARVRADSTFELYEYPSAVYGFVGFRVADARRAHPILGIRAVRRALVMAIDRDGLARNAFGPGAHAPPGPLSPLLWVGERGIATLPYDTAAATRLLDSAGWKRSGDGMRRLGSRRLAFDLLVPATSAVRRQLAVALQEAWRGVGVGTTVTAVDFPVFQERLSAGSFDAYIGAYLDEPSARGLAEQWSTDGIGALNHGRYSNPAFDSLLAAAGRTFDRERARALYRTAFDSLNADPPAVFLYTPVQTAAVARRIRGVTIDPFSWLSELPQWKAARSERTAHSAAANSRGR